jgi:hypothetical protein
MDLENRLINEYDLKMASCIEYVINQVKNKRTYVEKYLNACIFERIIGESTFRGLKKVLPSLMKKYESEFKLQF